MHLDEERLQRLIDGELTLAGEAAAREHVAHCAECRRTLMEFEGDERQANALLQTLDEPASELDAEAIAVLANNDGERPRQAFDPRFPARMPNRQPLWLRRVVAFGLAVALAGAALAFPGSPLPRWVRSWVERIERGATPVTPHPDSGDDAAGIAVTPGASLVIEFRSRQAEGEAGVSLTDGAELVIRAPMGAATFASDVERVIVDNHGRSASFRIEVPRAAPRVEIRVAGVSRFLKEGSRITLANPVAEDTYRIPLSSP
ncbi:MAG TPA: zf-HC2 domain-containing protein [Candidatus Eisenbacteria bacterium]|jgi:anti-sigma factor RsiW